MDLIIVESPTKAKTLSKFLGDGFRIEASMGHIRDLPESKLGIDVENDFAPTYVVPEKKQDRVKELQSLAIKATKVILATDPDREGEAISWHIASLITDELKNQKSKIKKKDKNLKIDGGGKLVRITFHEITESAIKEALGHPGAINMQLVDAQQARRILDRLVGYKLSPLLWRKIRRGLSAGRVQSVAVRLIVEREREIESFKAEEYWEIVAQVSRQEKADSSQSGVFQAKLLKINDKAAEIKSEADSNSIVGELERAGYQVSEVQTKEVRRNPYPPFTTSTLQQAASNLFGWSSKKTMQVAQNLYERGLITYHRTDSTNLASESVAKVRSFITSQYGEKYIPEKPRFFQTKSKVAQEAHEAIRPTQVEKISATGSGIEVDRDQVKLYELVWKRFVACQMVEALYEQKSVDIQATPLNSEVRYLFRAVGSKMLFDGWQRIFPKSEAKEQQTEEGSGELNGGILPELVVGEDLKLEKLIPSQHFTQPPPCYTEASLIKTLEEFGIGRPSTYAPIISTIQERQYVEKTDKKFHPTVLGVAVNDFLMANFSEVLDYKFTAGMEDDLDSIANGEKQWVPVLKEFYGPFEGKLKSVQDTAERVKVAVEESDEMCPEHNVPLVVRIGRFGKFLACSKFPECKFTKPFLQKVNMKCPKCGEGEVILKRTRSKKSFYGCSRYPACDWASWTKPKQADSGQR